MTTFQKLIGVSALIVSLTFAYYFLITIPERTLQKQEFIQSQIDEKENCLEQAKDNYLGVWDKACERFGLETSCALSANQANYIKDIFNTAQETCLKLYPSN